MRSRFNGMPAEFQLDIALLAARSHEHVMVESTSLAILPYGTMAEV